MIDLGKRHFLLPRVRCACAGGDFGRFSAPMPLPEDEVPLMKAAAAREKGGGPA